jgi:hypothetical protein
MSQTYKVVINESFGGFGLSDDAKSRLKELGQEYAEEYDYEWKIPRHDPILIQVVEELGTDKASGSHCRLRIAKIPCRTYRIEEYDGRERIITPNLEEWTVIG